jgi:VCBS repeat-containing protein
LRRAHVVRADWNYKVLEAKVQQLGAFATHHDVFAITIADNHGGRWTEDVTVTIIGSQPLNNAEPIFWISPQRRSNQSPDLYR